MFVGFKKTFGRPLLETANWIKQTVLIQHSSFYFNKNSKILLLQKARVEGKGDVCRVRRKKTDAVMLVFFFLRLQLYLIYMAQSQQLAALRRGHPMVAAVLLLS